MPSSLGKLVKSCRRKSPSNFSQSSSVSYPVIPLRGGGRRKHDQKVSSTVVQVKQTMLHGLLNRGNTCYMNSAIQCLLATQVVVDFFKKNSFKLKVDQDGNKGSGSQVTLAFIDVVQEYCQATQRTLDLSDLKDAVSELRPLFMGDQQQDAQEFLAILLDLMHEDLNESKNMKQHEEPDVDRGMVRKYSINRLANDAWKRYKNMNQSFVVDLFQGQLQSRVRCLECEDFLLKFEPFMYLSLPIKFSSHGVSSSNSKDISYTLEELFEAHEAPEILLEPCWSCPKCKKKVPVEKCINIIKLPKILMIHYKAYDGHSRKLTASISAPLQELDLSPYVISSQSYTIYDLYAVLDHTGSSCSLGGMNFGHYTASCKYEDQWYRFDDVDVQPIEEHKVVNRNNHVLFYECRYDQKQKDCGARRGRSKESWSNGFDENAQRKMLQSLTLMSVQ